MIAGSEVSLRGIRVKPGVVVNVDRVPVQASPNKTTAVEVSGPIALAGTVSHRVWYTAKQPIDTGLVTFARGAHVIGGRADGSTLVGDAVLYANDVMPGENKPGDEVISGVHVRCDALSLDWFDDDTPSTLTGDDSAWRPRSKTNSIWLRAQPKTGSPAVRLEYPSCGDGRCIMLAGIERRAGWIKVGESNEGVTVAGWVPAASLRRVPDAEADLGHTYGCFGDHEGTRFVQAFFAQDVGPHDARIKVGTQIYAEPGKGVWATVQEEIEVTVSYAPGDFWARVHQMPGVTVVSGDAYVLVSSLR